MNTGIDDHTKQKIINIISAIVPNASIYLFGSRARGSYQKSSDIDIALKESDRIDFVIIGELNSLFEASNIIHKIQVVDINAVSEKMRENILRDKIIWKK
jgi:predicted nucleotidyltransferase